MYFLTVREARSTRSRCCQGWSLMRPLFRFVDSWFPSHTNLSSVCSQGSGVGVGVGVEGRRERVEGDQGQGKEIFSSSSSYKDTSFIWLGPQPSGLHLTLITSLKALSSSMDTLGVRASTYKFWGDTTHSVTRLQTLHVINFMCLFCLWT